MAVTPAICLYDVPLLATSQVVIHDVPLLILHVLSYTTPYNSSADEATAKLLSRLLPVQKQYKIVQNKKLITHSNSTH
jgi:hypothetical protein